MASYEEDDFAGEEFAPSDYADTLEDNEDDDDMEITEEDRLEEEERLARLEDMGDEEDNTPMTKPQSWREKDRESRNDRERAIRQAEEAHRRRLRRMAEGTTYTEPYISDDPYRRREARKKMSTMVDSFMRQDKRMYGTTPVAGHKEFDTRIQFAKSIPPGFGPWKLNPSKKSTPVRQRYSKDEDEEKEQREALEEEDEIILEEETPKQDEIKEKIEFVKTPVKQKTPVFEEEVESDKSSDSDSDSHLSSKDLLTRLSTRLKKTPTPVRLPPPKGYGLFEDEEQSTREERLEKNKVPKPTRTVLPKLTLDIKPLSVQKIPKNIQLMDMEVQKNKISLTPQTRTTSSSYHTSPVLETLLSQTTRLVKALTPKLIQTTQQQPKKPSSRRSSKLTRSAKPPSSRRSSKLTRSAKPPSSRRSSKLTRSAKPPSSRRSSKLIRSARSPSSRRSKTYTPHTLTRRSSWRDSI